MMTAGQFRPAAIWWKEACRPLIYRNVEVPMSTVANLSANVTVREYDSAEAAQNAASQEASSTGGTALPAIMFKQGARWMLERCPNCAAGELKIIAAILERPMIEKILSHLGLDPQPGRRCARQGLRCWHTASGPV
jgi:hypothetical protein